MSYIFISHFEGDECGGLGPIIDNFPQAKPVCSQITARQLKGFGFTTEVIIKSPGETLETGDYKLSFIAYPSEMHLWEGLLAMETQRGILFSSDLFIHRQNSGETMINSKWEDELNQIKPEQIPSPAAGDLIKQTLRNLPVKYIAPGHGPFIKL